MSLDDHHLRTRLMKALVFVFTKIGVKQLIFGLLLGLYVTITAHVILVFERPNEVQKLKQRQAKLKNSHRNHTLRIVDELLSNTTIWEMPDNHTAEADLSSRFQLIDHLLLDYNHKMEHTDLAHIQKPTWNSKNAIYYVMTLYTTIGYGDVVCKTDVGKGLSIFFSLIGIPFMLLLISSVSTLFIMPINFIHKFARKIRNTWCRGKKIDEERSHATSLRFATPFILGFFTISGLIIHLRNKQRWSLFDTFYCWFMSLSTIGLGDLAIHEDGIVSQILSIAGLAVVSLTFSRMYTTIEGKYVQLFGQQQTDETEGPAQVEVTPWRVPVSLGVVSAAVAKPMAASNKPSFHTLCVQLRAYQGNRMATRKRSHSDSALHRQTVVGRTN